MNKILPNLDAETVQEIIENAECKDDAYRKAILQTLIDIRDELHKLNQRYGVQKWGPKI